MTALALTLSLVLSLMQLSGWADTQGTFPNQSKIITFVVCAC
jgi:hypothetical protein